MTCVIIEDEYNAYIYLESLLKKLVPDVYIIMHLESVEDAVNWFSDHPHPNLVFMDIQLSDGKSFEIFNHIQINAPIIFTTAYDQFALDAFKYNSIDYLLKPIHLSDLKKSLDKYHKQQFAFDAKLSERIIGMLNLQDKRKKHRCLVKKAKHFEYIEVKQIAFVNSDDGITFLHTFDKQRHIYSKSIEKLMDMLDEKQFFQISRSQIINIDAIQKVYPFFNQRLKIEVAPNLISIDLVVNRTKVKAFRSWMDE